MFSTKREALQDFSSYISYKNTDAQTHWWKYHKLLVQLILLILCVLLFIKSLLLHRHITLYYLSDILSNNHDPPHQRDPLQRSSVAPSDQIIIHVLPPIIGAPLQ